MNRDDLPPHLVKVPLEDFGIIRRKRGKGFSYLHAASRQPIRDRRVLQQLASVGVPTTWTRVRLTAEPRAYIRAVGYDGSGKLQYLYHEDYLTYRNARKFAELYRFGQALPRLRRRIQRDLQAPQWSERKLLALILKILDKYHLRIGSRVYARQNQSYGLTTLRKRHMREIDEVIHFEYTGKGAQKRHVQLTDPQLVRLIHELAEFPGSELFSLKQEGETLRADAEAINHYIKQVVHDDDFTARTFRTWAGTVLAIKYHEQARRIAAENPRRELPAVLAELVAKQLGNTPAICRDYYIHPGVFQAVVRNDFDPRPCNPRLLRQRLYRRHECRALEILSELESHSEGGNREGE